LTNNDERALSSGSGAAGDAVGRHEKAGALPGIGAVGPSGFKSCKIGLGRAGDIVVYRNPTEEQMRNLALSDKYNFVRGLKDDKGDIYLFPACGATHHFMWQQLGLEGAPKEKFSLLYDNGIWSKVASE
jgi:hypothetical protein